MPSNNPIIKNLPNFLTSMNILCGCIAVVIALNGKSYLKFASYFIFLAAIFDFLDGFSARLLKAYSGLGKQLDSLADMISFGFAPSIIFYSFLAQSMGVKSFSADIPFTSNLILASSFLITIFAALRLAKFNIDPNQAKNFIGLPTPATAIFVASLPLVAYFNPSELILFPSFGNSLYFSGICIYVEIYIMHVSVLLFLILLLSTLMVSRIRMFSLKFETFKFVGNRFRFIFLFISFIMFALVQTFAIPFIIFLYIFMSIVNHFIVTYRRKKTKENLERILAKKY